MNKEKTCITDKLETSCCTGCGACINCCPVDALSYGRDPWGYYIPVADKEKCIGCGKCLSVCPVYNRKENGHFEQPRCHAFISGNADELNASSSGGIFTRFSQAVFEKGGIVYGAAWSGTLKEDHLVRHEAAETETELGKLKKSKYLQSYIGYTYRDIQDDLKAGRQVLFTGCPCQVAGLKALLGTEDPNLLTIDLLCGNSPSEQFFRGYLSENFGDGAIRYEFRHKENDWRSDCVCITLENGEEKVFTGRFEDDFQSVYHDHTMCPPHCENCCFHSVPRQGDLTIGDFWGIMRTDPSIPGQNGVSVILVNSEKGQEFFDRFGKREGDYLREVPLAWLGGNGYTGKQSRNFASPLRDRFYEDYLKHGFTVAVHRAAKTKNRNEIDKWFGYFEVLLRWMQKPDPVGWLRNRVEECGYERIAIYGMGEVGRLLYEKMKSASIPVEYAIDKRPQKVDGQLKVVRPGDELEPVDVIIVSILSEFDGIRKLLEKKTDAKIISIRDFLL
ncbi:MAG: Coenzyme F420 hydrogenase/dehydrogenase, beta subunit C-terminal domain [Lachnospiraceae bacterium]|nr:Coenzyme F420 hydrogenase/dehydrogenase, beta subunit C-terminal domain [Lachnospiraceae bacterium]